MGNCNDQNSRVSKDVHNLEREPPKQEAASAFDVSRPGIRIFCNLSESFPYRELECSGSGSAPLAIPVGCRKTFCGGGFENLNDGRHSP